MYAPRSTDYRKYRKLRGTILVIEGSIGTGKSTLGRSLEKYLLEAGLNAKYYPEYINALFLEQYLKNMKAYAYPFQMFTVLKRLEIYREGYKLTLTGGIAIIDRSLLGDRTFAKMLHRLKFITDEEWIVYNEVLSNEAYPEPDYILYLDCTPKTSYLRMINRGIKSETSGYTIEYFEKLDKEYKKSIKETPHPVHIFDWNDDHELVVDQDIKYLTDVVTCDILDQIASLI